MTCVRTARILGCRFLALTVGDCIRKLVAIHHQERSRQEVLGDSILQRAQESQPEYVSELPAYVLGCVGFLSCNRVPVPSRRTDDVEEAPSIGP